MLNKKSKTSCHREEHDQLRNERNPNASGSAGIIENNNGQCHGGKGDACSEVAQSQGGIWVGPAMASEAQTAGSHVESFRAELGATAKPYWDTAR